MYRPSNASVALKKLKTAILEKLCKKKSKVKDKKKQVSIKKKEYKLNKQTLIKKGG